MSFSKPFTNTKNVDLLIFVSLVLLIVVSRLTSHVWNFTVVGGVALFAGSYFSKKYLAVAVPLLGLLISDFVIGFHTYMVAVYLSYALIVALGAFLDINSSRFKTTGFAILGSVLFFLITNFDAWMGSPLYTQDFAGLMQSYVMGVPFFRAQFIADVLTGVMIFECAKEITSLRQIISTSKAEKAKI